MRTRAILLLLSLGLGGCGTANTSVYPPNGYLMPNNSLKLTPALSITVEEALAVGIAVAAIYFVYDPLAPNWEIEEKPLGEDTYALSLRAKSFRIGGDGEAYQILKRRASQLQQLKGYDSYRIVAYSEGIESGTPFTYRVGEGTIKLVRK